MATNRIDAVERMMSRLADLQLKPARYHQVRAWLACRRGDVDTERAELQLLIEADPANSAALLRLAELAKQEGNTPQFDRLYAEGSRSSEFSQGTVSFTNENSQFATRASWPSLPKSSAGNSSRMLFAPSRFRTMRIGRSERTDSMSLDVTRFDPRVLRIRTRSLALHSSLLGFSPTEWGRRTQLG